VRHPTITQLLRHGSPLTLALLLTAGPVLAQCTVTGPAALCGGSAELCGPDGPYEYFWVAADGTPLGDQRCLVVSAPGTYRLSTFDFINGLWAGPCDHVIAAAGSTGCTIGGPTSACAGTAIPLCGPDGALEFEWSGPNGFASTARCIEATVGGEYRLRTRTSAGGCWSDPCAATVAFTDCQPPPPSVASCPLDARDWSLQCRVRRGRLFDAAQMAQIAKRVAERSKLCARERGGLCRILDNRCNLEARARRQLAAVLANVAAHELGLTPRLGPARGLDPKSQLKLDDFTGTVEEWTLAAEARLVSLGSRKHRQRALKEAYRDVIAAGWRINHGIGIDLACADGPKRPGLGAVAADEDSGEESLAAELDGEVGPSLAFESLEPNPSTGPTRIAFSVASLEDTDVSIGIYDISGRRVRQLQEGPREPGRHEIRWDGRDALGNALTNGAYFVVGRIGAEKIATRLVLVR
jgi:hypothetical protein